MDTVNNNLSTFRILYNVKGVLTMLFSLIFLAYAFFGFFIEDLDPSAGDAPFDIRWIFGIFGGVCFLFTVTLAVFTFLTAKYLNQKRNYNFILVMAIINCLTGVLGILLGVFTIVELSKPEVKALFYPDTTPTTA